MKTTTTTVRDFNDKGELVREEITTVIEGDAPSASPAAVYPHEVQPWLRRPGPATLPWPGGSITVTTPATTYVTHNTGAAA